MQTGEVAASDFAGVALFCVTALVLAILALQRRGAQDQLVQYGYELEAAVEREAAVSRSKDEFLRLVSHELRNPIAVISGSADILEKRKVTGAAKNEVVHDIHVEARRVHHLIEDLLTLARLEEGLKPEREPLRVDLLARRAIDEFHERYPQQVTLMVDESSGLALGSEVQIERVFANLLGNAGKYSPRSSTISIEARRLDSSLAIDILDQGPGVPTDEVERIFDVFERVSAPEETRGYGLGLALSKRMVEANDGRIWARNRDGGGFDVGFSLPRYRE
jgi:signal transduction histidine kinase